MGADACHHTGALRPTSHTPLPSSLPASLELPTSLGASTPCPGTVFEKLLVNQGRHKNEPFYEIAQNGISQDVGLARDTLEKIRQADAQDEVFVVIAHDASLKGIVDFFPLAANDWFTRGWAKDGKWAFLKDFAGAAQQLHG
jgi:hypothetical protein